MGSEWSCPCADREKIKRRVLENEEATKTEKAQPGVQVKIFPMSKIERLLKPAKNGILASMSKHPRHDKPLCVYQQQADIDFTYTPNRPYELFKYNYDLPENLAGEIQQRFADGFIFIGGFFDSRHIQLLFYSGGASQERKILVKMESGFDLDELKKVFIEEENCLFLGCIAYKDSALIIFEKSTTPFPYTYFVAPFPQSEIDDVNFEFNLAEKIDECVKNENVKFKGCLSYLESLYLIFIK